MIIDLMSYLAFYTLYLMNSSVCTQDNGLSPSIVRAVPDNVFIDNIAFTPFMVAMAIKWLKAGKSCGPDSYPPFLFKKLIYSAFMSVGRIPSAWTRAIVTPVFKRGNTADIRNYRPISLTSVVCKLMERIISTDVLHYLRSQNVSLNTSTVFSPVGPLILI